MSILTLPPFQDFLSRETDFYLYQFLSNIFKYSFSNFPSSYSYGIFVIYFSSNSPLLKFFSSAIPNFFYLLTSVFTLPSNSTTISFVFSKFSSLSQILYSTINLFYHTKYFTTPLTFLLFNIFSTIRESQTPNSKTSTLKFAKFNVCSQHYRVHCTYSGPLTTILQSLPIPL